MDARRYADAYPRELSTATLHQGSYSTLIHKEQEWAHWFGTIMHDRLTQHDGPMMERGPQLNTYFGWLGKKTWPQTFPGSTLPEVQQLHAEQEAHFHLLNHSMLRLWRPIFNGRWESSAKRKLTLQESCAAVAIGAVPYYHLRERLASPKAGYAYFSDAYAQKRATLEGILHEADAAIVLMRVAMAHPELTVVPAPPQFERTRKSRNVDFLVVDVSTGNAIGVQVKSSVREKTVEQYDGRYVVLIDGRTDFANERYMRVSFANTTPQPVSWAGIVAAKQAIGMPTARISHNHRAQVIALKMQAKQDAQRFALDPPRLAGIVRRRIEAKL